MNHPELLSPAGSLKAMRAAFAYGADAVYAGMPRYSLRVRNNEFTPDNLPLAIAEARSAGKRFFLTLNLLPHNRKLATFLEDIAPAIAAGPDAVIMADPGLIMLVRERWPEMAIHLSVQANTMNWAAVKFWHSVGITRVILSRELSLGEIAEIRDAVPEMEIEVFVHGALCIAYSGRCLLSGYFNHRDPNQGTCTNACRWEYRPSAAQQDAEGVYRPVVPQPEADAPPAELRVSLAELQRLPESAADAGGARHPLAERVWFLEEPNRPGELMPVEEDEHGTYILNSRDLRAVEHVPELVAAGVHSFKIEGRTKSAYYVARTAQVYRRAIDDAVAGRPFDSSLLGALDHLAHRGYTAGFYQRHHTQEHQNYLSGVSRARRSQLVAELLQVDGDMALLEVKNRFGVGDRLELMTPEGNHDHTLEHLEAVDGRRLEIAPGSGWRVRIPWPNSARPQLDLEHSPIYIARYLEEATS